MRHLFARRHQVRVLRGGVLSAFAILAAGCSSETTRFADSTGSTYAAQPSYGAPAPPPGVTQQPLPPTSYAPSQSGPQYSQPQYNQAPYGQPQRAQALPPPAPAPAPEVTGGVRSGGHWERAGGTTIVLAQGETIAAVARTRGIPIQAIMEANGITDPKTVAAGQRIVIPHYVPGGSGAKLAHATAPRAPEPKVVAAPNASASVGAGQTLLPAPPVHTVASGDTLSKIAREYHVKVKDLAVANGMEPQTPLKIGAKITVPVRVVAAPPKGKVAAAAPKPQQVAASAAPAKPGAPTKLASVDKAQVVIPSETSDETGATAAGAPAFRWPTRGRVIAGFGAKVNGISNDGIDLAVPEGTPVRAADDGVVAYAGSELKGYGNLVLVRHANGFVTAYANASELMVKRNDQIHKGQVIAKSGQTGTAANPQLHFEVRKNSTPVDPIQYLPSDKTASAPL
jgi:murein DD-endopeptidase MepM/ murein hydrolase activator NlpD